MGVQELDVVHIKGLIIVLPKKRLQFERQRLIKPTGALKPLRQVDKGGERWNACTTHKGIMRKSVQKDTSETVKQVPEEIIGFADEWPAGVHSTDCPRIK